MPDAITVFDRRQVRRQRDRASRSLAAHDFLFREAAERLADRLSDVERRFPMAADLGARTGIFGSVVAGRGGIQQLIQTDLAPGMVSAIAHPALRLVADEEALPFAASSLDLIVSVLSLHWVNDLPGALLQIRQALRPDGLFLGSLFGGETIRELRQCLAEAEIAERGGLSPRASPFTDVRDAGGLLQRAGFALPVVDADEIIVTYPDALALMRDLRGMGETNAVLERARAPAPRTLFARAAALYAQRFGTLDGRIPATFQILTLTGWAPAPTQQRALRPGSAQSRLSDALGVEEYRTGELP